MIKKINYNLITLFVFNGLIQKHRGTWASLFTTIFLFLVLKVLNISVIFISFLILIIFFYSLYAIKECLQDFKDEDPQQIVIDEFIGQSIPICLYELFHSNNSNNLYESLQIYFWFFLLFRLFDGLKPFPIDYIDRKYKNSLGIVFDDVLAGIYVVLCLILFMIGKTFFY
tara:strand:+ start:10294 stop:10803 length:510 start_codon:yes stop_codon:yes gene_type:complete